MCEAPSIPSDPVIRIAAAIIRDREGRHLLVRKAGTNSFMQAGGKLEAYERPIDALTRELGEELKLKVQFTSLRYFGLFEAPAAHEPGLRVVADIFEIDAIGQIEPSAEIEELLWVDPRQKIMRPLAPLTELLLERCSR